jgi:hypothetical protein
VIEPAPPYRGEGPHALWHVSGDGPPCDLLGCTSTAEDDVAYRLPEEPFERWDRFWIAERAAVPLEVVELGNLVARHEAAGIELRADDDLLGLWDDVVSSTLDFSGIRLRNATMAS